MSTVTRHARILEMLAQAARDPFSPRTTRERLWDAAERITSIDPDFARALGALLINAADDPHRSSACPTRA